MRNSLHNHGARELLRTLGVIKESAAPAMGGPDYNTFTSATGDSGRVFGRGNESPADGARTAFMENDRHTLRDPANDAVAFPVGAQQSLGVKAAYHDVLTEAIPSAHPAYAKLRKEAPLPIKDHPWVKTHGPFYASELHADGPYIGHNKDYSEALLAHELGHHEVQQGSLTKYLQHPVARLMHLGGPLAAFATGRLASSGYKIPAVAGMLALMHGPTLASEGLADYYGYQKLKDAGADNKALKDYIRDLALPQSSYVANTAISGLMGYAGHKMAARKLEGRLTFRGLEISIETDKGSKREWHDPHSGESGSTLMKFPYGYIRKTLGTDGDHVDVYVGPNEAADNVYIVNQMKKPDFKTFDEQKCMLGFDNAIAAKKAYLDHYNDDRFFGSMATLSFEEFKTKVLDKDNHGEKVASNMYQADFDRPMGTGPGPTHNQVPGDFLGLPMSQPGGYKRIVGGHPETPLDNIDRMFRFHDEPTDMRVLESSNVPESPGV